LVHPFFAELARSISQVLRERGYGLLISSSEEKADLELQEIEQVLARGVDAIIIASAQLTAEAFRQIEERKVRYVLLDRQFPGLSANFVGIDDELVGDLATDHLITVGCRRIALIRGPEVSTSIGRMKGYCRTLLRHGRDLRSDYIVSTETGDEAGEASGYHAMKRLLKINPQPDGVFCYNDPTALGAMKAIFEGGLQIPRDIAVIGCGNVVYASFLRVPLSSIDQSNSEMGTRAGELALLLIESKPKSKPTPQTVLLTPKVVARASTAR
jgi:LacI family transcriptional regulator